MSKPFNKPFNPFQIGPVPNKTCVETIYDLCLQMNDRLMVLKNKVTEMPNFISVPDTNQGLHMLFDQMNDTLTALENNVQMLPTRWQMEEMLDRKIERGAELVIEKLRKRGNLNNLVGFFFFFFLFNDLIDGLGDINKVLHLITEAEEDEDTAVVYGSGSLMGRLQRIEEEFAVEFAKIGGGKHKEKEQERNASGGFGHSPLNRTGKLWHGDMPPRKPKAKSKVSPAFQLIMQDEDDEDDESCVETGSSSSSSIPTQTNFADFVGSLQNLVASVSPSSSASSTPKKKKVKKKMMMIIKKVIVYLLS
jgi:hypothetical protein